MFISRIHRQKKPIDSFLELVKVTAIRKKSEGSVFHKDALLGEITVHVVLWVMSLNMKEMGMILLDH